MTLLKDNNFKDINVALLSLEADIKNKITGFDTSVIDKQLAEINSRIDKINDGSNNTSDEIEDINSKLNSNSNKIKNIERNIEDIDTQIDGIEQKLSDIFSAENKVTDFNTTTNSGIYYWIIDAANRPSNYGVLLVNKYDSGSGSTWINQIAYGTNNKIYFRQNINSGNWTDWKAVAFEGELNALTVNGKTYDGSEAVDAGVQTVENGGTGATTAKGAQKSLLSDMQTETTEIEDTTDFVMKYETPTDTKGALFKRSATLVWNYIKDKISSVLGLTKDNYGGNAATADKATTATTAETATKVSNALTVNGKTYNGSEAVDAGVQTVENGGTGVTTQADINKAFIGNLGTGDSDVTDGTEFVSSYASDNGFAEPSAINKPYKRQFVKVWNYIKDKISSVLGLTATNYGGKASTAATADSANKIEPNYTKSLSLTEVTSETIKYVKIADCNWDQSGTLQVYLSGNAIVDTLVINFGGGNATTPMLCGYYHGHNYNVSSVIARKGSTYSSDYSIYVKVRQQTNCSVRVALLKGSCTINITESTTAPKNISEWPVNYGFFGTLAGKSAKSSFLDKYSSTRLTSGNIKPKDSSEWGGMRKDVVTSSMTDGSHPGQDGHLLTMFWDNDGRWDNQLFISNDEKPKLKVRGKANKTDYSPWSDIITSNNIGSQTVANATNARTNADQGFLCKLYTPNSATSDTTSQAYNVILLGKIPDPASTEAPATPASSWDIDVDFYFVRSQGHKASWCNVKAGYGYSNAWRKYGYIETFGVDSNSNYAYPFYLVTLKYNNEYYIGVRHTMNIDGSYAARVKYVNVDGGRNPSTVNNTPLVNMLKVIPYQKTNGTILNNEIKTSIADFPNTYAPTVIRNGSLVLPSGSVTVGNSSVAGSRLTIRGATVNSNSYTDTNPKLEFKNNDGSQNISLTFTDWDKVQEPASLTLNGNQGNEYFIAPNIKATTKFIGNLTGNVTGNSETATIAESANKIVPNYTKSLDLKTVTSATTKYIKVADCAWRQTGTLQVHLAGNGIEDTLVINFGGGNALHPMLCGHYSGHAWKVLSVITQNGSEWNSNYSIYVKVTQITTCTVKVALLKGSCTINITESTTAPTNIYEWAISDGFFGNLTGNVIGNVTGSSGSANKLTTARKAYVDLGTASSTSTIDWSGDTTIPVNGVLQVEHGGTGATTAEAAANSLIASLASSQDVPVDSDYFISQVVNGGPFVPGYERRPISKLWEYIKGKILQEGEDFGYDHIVHDGASLLEWANCTDGSMKKVLIKSGTHNITKGVDFSKAGTGYVFAEQGAVINSHVPIAFTASSGKTVAYNLSVVCDGAANGDNSCAFSASNPENLILYDCSATYRTYTEIVNRSLFVGCTCYNCSYAFQNLPANSSISMKVFYQCRCYNCKCLQTIEANSSTGIIFDSDSYFYMECHCASCDAELTTLRNIKSSTKTFACYYNCYDRCVGCLSKINVNSKALTVYSTLYGFFRCQYISSCKETHTEGYTNIKGITQCDFISSTSGINGGSNTHVGNSCSIQ